jgi:hypothetical protein
MMNSETSHNKIIKGGDQFGQKIQHPWRNKSGIKEGIRKK